MQKRKKVIIRMPQKEIHTQGNDSLRGPGAEDIPFKFIGNHLYLPVIINGDEKLWCLDTGAQLSVIDSNYASVQGLVEFGKVKTKGAAAKALPASLVILPTYSAAGITFNQQPMVSMDINGLFQHRLGMEVGGILGTDFLSRFVTKIDYANERISFYHPDQFEYKGESAALAAPLLNNIFTVSMTVDTKFPGMWALDLGAEGISFNYPYAKQKGFLKCKGIDRMGAGVGGPFTMRILQFGTVEFAGFTVQNPVIGFPLKKGKGIISGKELAGNLGNNFLRNFVLYLDYKREQVIVEKGKNFNRRFPADKSGLQLTFSLNHKLEVLWASPGTPAAVAGFQKGDIIKSINNSPVESFKGMNDIQRLFQEEVGTQYVFQVLRDGQVIEIRFALEDWSKKCTYLPGCPSTPPSGICSKSSKSSKLFFLLKQMFRKVEGRIKPGGPGEC